MYRNFLSKKLLAILGVILIFFTIFIIFTYKNDGIRYESSLKKKSLETEKITQQIIDIDSDNDGLKDWEEILWKTDPNNPDTDSDGMGDNEEIINGRDPLVKGEGNINNIIYTQEKSSQPNKTPLTQTDILAREIFTSYIALKQNDALGTQEQEDLIQTLALDKLNFKPEINYITLGDLNIVKNSSQEAIQKYALELKQLLSKAPELRDDNLILKEALDKNSPEILKEIDSNIIFYKKLIVNLKKMEIPLPLQDLHLKLTNLLIESTVYSKQLTKIFEDPILALTGAKQYYEVMGKILTVSIKLGQFFRESNIQI